MRLCPLAVVILTLVQGWHFDKSVTTCTYPITVFYYLICSLSRIDHDYGMLRLDRRPFRQRAALVVLRA